MQAVHIGVHMGFPLFRGRGHTRTEQPACFTCQTIDSIPSELCAFSSNRASLLLLERCDEVEAAHFATRPHTFRWGHLMVTGSGCGYDTYRPSCLCRSRGDRSWYNSCTACFYGIFLVCVESELYPLKATILVSFSFSTSIFPRLYISRSNSLRSHSP